MNEHFDRIDQHSDCIDKRFNECDLREDQRFNENTDRMEKCWIGQDPKSVDSKGDLRSNCQTEGLPVQQVHPADKDAYNDMSGESEDDFTA